MAGFVLVLVHLIVDGGELVDIVMVIVMDFTMVSMQAAGQVTEQVIVPPTVTIT